MANTGGPPKKKINPKGEPPQEAIVKETLTKNPSNKQVPLNFKVENEFRREFKGFANDRDMPMVKLLEICFENYKQQTQI